MAKVRVYAVDGKGRAYRVMIWHAWLAAVLRSDWVIGGRRG